MPTLYHSESPDKLLIIHGLDANPVYLPLYVRVKIEEILYSLRNSAILFSESVQVQLDSVRLDPVKGYQLL
jgi:hypothetical protein